MNNNGVFSNTNKNFTLGGMILSNQKRQFKENTQSGEHRNGRKSQYKNYNAEKGEAPNEYLSKRD